MHARQRHHLRHSLYQRRGQHPGTRRPGDRHVRDGVIRINMYQREALYPVFLRQAYGLFAR